MGSFYTGYSEVRYSPNHYKLLIISILDIISFDTFTTWFIGCGAATAELEIAVSHQPFSNQFHGLADQN